VLFQLLGEFAAQYVRRNGVYFAPERNHFCPPLVGLWLLLYSEQAQNPAT
jgi:hypothetical protein